MIINIKCHNCGQRIPETRRRDSRFCSTDCRTKFRRAYFATPAGGIPVGEYLVALRGEVGGNVLVSHSRAVRTRIRTARASCSEPLTLIGVVPADAARATRFRRAHTPFLLRGSWYRGTPELLEYFERRSLQLDRIAANSGDQEPKGRVGSEEAA